MSTNKVRITSGLQPQRGDANSLSRLEVKRHAEMALATNKNNVSSVTRSMKWLYTYIISISTLRYHIWFFPCWSWLVFMQAFRNSDFRLALACDSGLGIYCACFWTLMQHQMVPANMTWRLRWTTKPYFMMASYKNVYDSWSPSCTVQYTPDNDTTSKWISILQSHRVLLVIISMMGTRCRSPLSLSYPYTL